VIDRGWIRIAPFEHSPFGAEAAGLEALALIHVQGDCSRSIDADTVAEVHEVGNCWIPSPPDDGCTGSATCGGGGGGDCTLEFVMHSNARIAADTFAAECGAGLSYSFCGDGEGGNYYCIREG
jgi:hypothetical protein